LKIQAPTNCPSCSSDLIWKNDLLYCENVSCEGQGVQKLEHFAKTLKIKGLGPATIDKLQLESIFDIYNMSLDLLTELLSSEKLAGKLFLEIEGSKAASLQEVLPAFSIPLIGKSASEKLCSVLYKLDDLSEGVCESAGLGPKATQNLMVWFREEYLPYYKSLPFSFASETSKPSTASMGIVCITGKLSSVKTKAEAEKALVEAGFSVRSSLTKEVTILLNESGIESAKTKKARDNGVSIFTNLFELIGV
jgi:NAD-dependent DNA ligase